MSTQAGAAISGGGISGSAAAAWLPIRHMASKQGNFLEAPDKQNFTGLTGLKTGLTGFLFSKIFNPVNPEKSC
jgi:hypothetical protein